MSKFVSGADNLDALFEPIQAGDPKRAATKFITGTQNLADRYAAASLGTAGANCQFTENGTNIGPTFCKKGTAVRGTSVSVKVGLYYDPGDAFAPSEEARGYDDFFAIGTRNPTSYNSFTILGLYFYSLNAGTPAFRFELAGNHAIGYIDSLDIENMGKVLSADASHSYDSTNDFTRWSWVGPGGWPWADAETRTVVIA